MPGEKEIIQKVDVNKDWTIDVTELNNFLKNSKEDDLKDLAQTLDRDNKALEPIIHVALYKAHDDIAQKIMKNENLTSSDISLLKLYIYLVKNETDISFQAEKDFTKNYSLQKEIRSINPGYKNPLLQTKKTVSIVSIEHQKNEKITFENLSFQERMLQINLILKSADIYYQYLQSKAVPLNLMYFNEFQDKIKDAHRVETLSKENLQFYLNEIFKEYNAPGMP